MSEMINGRWWIDGMMLVDGCTPVSSACKNCWSAAMTQHWRPGEFTKPGNVWNGKVQFNKKALDRFNRKKRAVFATWNDLFHKGVTDNQVFLTLFEMMDHDQHQYLILTKRPERVLKIINGWLPAAYLDKLPDHIWIGTTVENQQTADERIPHLLKIPGNTFLSMEPLLEKVGLAYHFPSAHGKRNDRFCVIAGGETGAGARPSHPDWFRSIRDQCAEAGVPFFLKSLGQGKGRKLDGRTHDELPWRSNAN